MLTRLEQSFQSRTGRQKVNPKALDETHQVLDINFKKYLNPMCEQYCRYNPHEAECIVYLLSFFLLFFSFYLLSCSLFKKEVLHTKEQYNTYANQHKTSNLYIPKYSSTLSIWQSYFNIKKRAAEKKEHKPYLYRHFLKVWLYVCS